MSHVPQHVTLTTGIAAAADALFELFLFDLYLA